MSKFADDYSSPYAYFIAEGRSLEAIKKEEAFKANIDAMEEAIARDYGADRYEYGSLYSDHPLPENPALALSMITATGGGLQPNLMYEKNSTYDGPKEYSYRANWHVPEGEALRDRMDSIPEYYRNVTFLMELFGKNEYGDLKVDYTLINPDKLENPETHTTYTTFGDTNDASAAKWTKYGDTYVIAVPRTIRGIFNAASEKETAKLGLTDTKIAAGYRYDWFTPPGSKPIPYSEVLKLAKKEVPADIALKEKETGDQTKPKKVMGNIRTLKQFTSTVRQI